MLGFIKTLPIIILLAGAGYAAHKFVVGQLETRIANQQQQIDVLNQQNVGLQAAAELNENTIRSLEESNKQQIAQISTLSTQSSEWERQARDAMKIFSDHNFTKLARLRPQMIEDRANNATREVFDSVEQDSKDTADLGNSNETN
jgi:uncharacterized coiled-coil protein SlyX